jgi:peptide/nickel transport system substrate-binding protein
MYNTTSQSPDPQVFMNQFVTWEIASKDNKWSGRNVTRFRHEEYDRLWRAAESEMDPVKRAAQFIRMNDILIENVVVIPVLWRYRANAVSNKLKNTESNGWDCTTWNLANWYRET